MADKIAKVDKIADYQGQAGVWAIRGKLKEKRDSGEWIWLNVAKTQNIGGEVSEDIKLMSDTFENPLIKKTYTSKWNEVLAEYRVFEHDPRRAAVWQATAAYIRVYCVGYEIWCIAEKADKRREQDFAFYTKAEFWSDAPRYTSADEEIAKRRLKYIEDRNLEEEFAGLVKKFDERQCEPIYSTLEYTYEKNELFG